MMQLFRKMCWVTVLGIFSASFALAQNPDSDATLNDKLQAQSAAFAERMPAPLIQSIDDSIKGVEDTGILNNTIDVGDTAPDFTLPDAVGDSVQLSDLLAEGPVVLTWYRGNW